MAQQARDLSEELPPTGVLAEFREALKQEIEAAKRSSNAGGVALVNGRRIAQVGSSFHYVFLVESTLNLPASVLSLPGDTPGDLYLPIRPPIEVTVVSTDGMSIFLSVPVDIGTSIPKARLQSNLAQLMRKLIQRIERMASVKNKGGDRILNGESQQGSPVRFHRDDLEPEQSEAVASALGRDTTFIWGPPGTGKTTTIGAIGCELYEYGRSVLLVSHTNTAVDGALLSIANRLGESFPDGSILRVGDPVDSRLAGSDLLSEEQVRKRSFLLQKRLAQLERELEEKRKDSVESQRILMICEWIPGAMSDIVEMARDLEEILRLRDRASQAKAVLEELERLSAVWEGSAKAAWAAQQHAQRAGDLMRQWDALALRKRDGEERLAEAKRSLAEAVELEVAIEPASTWFVSGRTELETEAASASKMLDDALQQLAQAEDLLARTSAVNLLIRRWKGLPDLDRQRSEVERLQEQVRLGEERREKVRERVRKEVQRRQKIVNTQEAELDSLTTESAHILERVERLHDLMAWFERTYQSPPEEILAKAEEHRQKLETAREEAPELEREAETKKRRLNEQLTSRLTVLKDLGLAREMPVSAEAKLTATQQIHRHVATEYAAVDLNDLRKRIQVLNERIRQIEEEILDAKDQLKRVEEILIANAKIVATTLTRAYLREPIQARRFDTVILDEASMAPIPALWVAAGLADTSVVVVGDFKQLPPIVLSAHELARKWLGRDIFEVSGIQEAVEKDLEPAHLIQLKSQHRMHPEISSICNHLIYDLTLRDSPKMDESQLEAGLFRWYRQHESLDAPVLLVDTGGFEAWVTSVPRGKTSSRLNILNASLSVHIAESFLRVDRERIADEQPYRILLCCPYRPQAGLMQLLVNDGKLEREVLSGTAHSFQGKEADVVIIDLVNDEPHRRVALFQRDFDEATRRLLNVAFTRARRRLVVIGDFSYMRAQGRHAFLGHRLIPFLEERYPCVEAAALVSKLTSFREGEPGTKQRLFIAKELWKPLCADIRNAKESVVIYSPALSETAVDEIGSVAEEAARRFVKIYVITKTAEELGKGQVLPHRRLVEQLRRMGIRVLLKRGMREKIALIDDHISWICSVSILGDGDGEGVVERRVSPLVAKEYASVLWTRKLLQACDDEELGCPFCGSEIVAAEGNEAPFYWRCAEDDCYTRSADEPFLRQDFIVCKSCSSPVELGEWDDEPYWLCKRDGRHRQRVKKVHLRLRKMRDLIPKAALRKLDKRFGLVETQSSLDLQ